MKLLAAFAVAPATASAVATAAIDLLVQGDEPVAKTVEEFQKEVDEQPLGDVARKLQLSGEADTVVEKLVIAEKEQSTAPTFSEKSLDKARRILNGMVEEAQVQLDQKVIQCKEFHERNRTTYNQIRTDLARLAEQCSDLDRQKAAAVKAIQDADLAIQSREEERESERIAFQGVRQADEQEMRSRKNDLAVAQFILKITKCPGTLAQLDGEVKFCADSETPFTVEGNDQLAQELAKLETIRGRELAQLALLSASPGLVDGDHEDLALLAAPPGTKRANKCSLGKANCGLLHDNMSLMWGEMKDAVDQLQVKMDNDEGANKKMMANYNNILQVLAASKSTAQTQLSEATAARNTYGEEQAKKEAERRLVEAQFKETYVEECLTQIHELMFTNLCGTLKVRGEVMKHSKTVKPDDIQDCAVCDFVPGPCSVPCDDTLKGGVQTLSREVVAMGNKLGTKCPTLQLEKKCGQVKCPVHCKMSSWSRWSACSTGCGGGVQAKTRSVVVKPKNGGRACDVTLESRPCNTGSCDRNCRLRRWTRFSPCTQACTPKGGRSGFAERFRNISRPVRGNGRCPKPTSRLRYWKKRCNKKQCVGDEHCIARQDLIIAVDGSGSLRESGFDVLKKFVKKYIKRLDGVAFQRQAVRVGIVLFGNGKVLKDGTISKAILHAPLSNKVANVASSVDKLTWQKGFTNLAQVAHTAKSAFMNGGRRSAQSMLLIVTDGKPSFKFQTGQALTALRKGGVNVAFALVRSFPGKDGEQIKQWASQPWQTNYVPIPGVKKLEADTDFFVAKTLVQACPNARSTSRYQKLIRARGYESLKFGAFCPEKFTVVKRIRSVGHCAAAAINAGKKYFMTGKRRGTRLCLLSDSKDDTCSGKLKNRAYNFYRLSTGKN